MKKSAYVLESVEAIGDSVLEDSYSINHEDGSINCRREIIGVYDSVENAEKDIRRLIKQGGEYVNYFAFVLTEHYMNNSFHLGKFNSPSLFESIRTYLGDGRLNCFSDYDDGCVKKFIGRTTPQKFVKDGDYCLVLNGDKIYPIILLKTTPTKKYCDMVFQHGFVGDCTDDSGVAIGTEGGHFHPRTPSVFPLWNLKNYSIDEKTKTQLTNEKARYEDGCF